MKTLIVVANLGYVKAFRVERTPTRGERLEPAGEVAFLDAHGRFLEKVTDVAGRFAGGGSGSGPVAATARGKPLSARWESHRRLVREIAAHIEALLQKEAPELWHFAAGGDIHEVVFARLSPSVRARVGRRVCGDLMKLPPGELAARFAPAWA